MALIIGDTAIVSLGVSCQTAFQLEDNRHDLEEWLGGTAVRRGTPFDWLICGIQSTAKMISAGRFYPEEPELAVTKLCATWPAMKCFYWHEAREDVSSGASSAKFAHIGASFFELASTKRLIFIASNTQSNLDQVVEKTSGDFNYLIDDSSMGELRSALDLRFRTYELYLVSYSTRHALTAIENRAILYEIDPAQNTGVRGKIDQWKPVLGDILRR